MAQPFSLRYMLVDGGQLWFHRRRLCRGDALHRSAHGEIAHELLADLEKETVDFVPNYDGTEQIPEVLPTKIPNLLVNGSSGIAVGMATNIPPHNLTEVINGCGLYRRRKHQRRRVDGAHPRPRFPDRRHHQRASRH